MKRTVGAILMAAVLLVSFVATVIPVAAITPEENDTTAYYQYNVKYDSTALWTGGWNYNYNVAKGNEISFRSSFNAYCHITEADTPNLIWWNNFTYHPEDCSLDVNGQLNWYSGQGYGNLGKDDPNAAISFEIYYDPATFAGLTCNADSVFATIGTDGVFTTKEGVSIGQLAEDWNTVTLYFIPTYENDAIVNCKVYFSINDIGAGITADALTALPSFTWAITKTLVEEKGTSGFKFNVADAADGKYSRIRNFLGMTLTETDVYQVNLGDAAAYVEPGSDYILPEAPGIAGYANDGTTYAPGATITVTENMDFTVIPTAPDADNAFSIVFPGHEDLNTVVASGETLTFPDAAGVDLWKVDGTLYAPGDTMTVTGPCAPVPVSYSYVYVPTLAYDTDELWVSAGAERNSIKDDSWGSYHKTEWPTPNLLWWNSTSTGDYVYDPDTCALTINSFKSGGNGVQLYIQRPAAALDGCQTLIFTADVYYTPGDFDGFRIVGYFTQKADNYAFARMDTDGRFYTYQDADLSEEKTITIGQLTEGWNTVAMYILPNYASDGTTVSSYEVYFTLNDDGIDAVISEDWLATLPHTTWERSPISSAVTLTYRPLDSSATADAPASMKIKSLTAYSMSREILATVNFSKGADPISVPLGTEITLPSPDDIDGWQLGDTFYALGSTFVVDKVNVTFQALDETATAYAAMNTAAETLRSAEDNEKIQAILNLADAMGNALISEDDDRYQAASEVLLTAIAEQEENIENQLLLFTEAETIEETYEALSAAIRICRPLRDLLDADLVDEVCSCIDVYNIIIGCANAEIVEAITICGAISSYKVDNQNIAAILADIKSKVNG